MCGICGCVGSADEELTRAMTQLLAHRGPDGEGVRIFPASDGKPPAALGHRRLAIIDPGPRGAQLMAYQETNDALRIWALLTIELWQRAFSDDHRIRAPGDAAVVS
jgi:asparagine synthetase B (glutamine-hydrolysing)